MNGEIIGLHLRSEGNNTPLYHKLGYFADYQFIGTAMLDRADGEVIRIDMYVDFYTRPSGMWSPGLMLVWGTTLTSNDSYKCSANCVSTDVKASLNQVVLQYLAKYVLHDNWWGVYNRYPQTP